MKNLNILTEELIIANADLSQHPTRGKKEYVKSLEKKILEEIK